MSAIAYIITRSENDYNQYGEYFYAWFRRTPERNDIRKLFYEEWYCEDPNKADPNIRDAREIFITNLLAGGGRQSVESTWYHLHKWEMGVPFPEEH